MTDTGINKYKTGLVLSGGAYRGMGQIGALQALEERGIKPDVLSGTSAGGLNAVLYASGYSPKEMYDIWLQEPFGKAFNFHIPNFGLLKHAKIEELVKPYMRYERLEELPLPVFLSSTCLNNGKQKIFREGPLPLLLAATCAVPVVFEPVEIEGRQYVDGGLISNLPAEPLQGLCEKLIGITVNPIPDKVPLDGFREVLYRTIWIGFEGTVDKNRHLFDWLIEPPEMGEHGIMDRSSLEVFYQAGYDYTCQFLNGKGFTE